MKIFALINIIAELNTWIPLRFAVNIEVLPEVKLYFNKNSLQITWTWLMSEDQVVNLCLNKTV
jgi:hypothetical protein